MSRRRNQAEEMSQAAHEFTVAAQELTATLNRFLNFVERGYQAEAYGESARLPGSLTLGFLGAGDLSEEEAEKLAHNTIHQAREELGRAHRLPAPKPGEAEGWLRKRQERREREGY